MSTPQETNSSDDAETMLKSFDSSIEVLERLGKRSDRLTAKANKYFGDGERNAVRNHVDSCNTTLSQVGTLEEAKVIRTKLRAHWTAEEKEKLISRRVYISVLVAKVKREVKEFDKRLCG